MDWMKIFSALLIVLMLVYLLPRAKDMIKNSPKASNNDWMAALIPLILVIGFVFLLIKSV
ncbi:MAG: hypothetical protein KZQ64_06195 [gamma proteobacterium symbiont of Bathyaustriella thionipta]|nr:hypothetical protein [gamma proteobacterium symbiont of Bathyaustriella thionipta]MCU7950523.1 hypothetical protein [gamma proteobacterium symbiont of Bathyaustriella thionipta]MCU7952968.1 hypothetical protein [gamma proteobacterium symbiont of Bathyaustriella thionipta]MCU7957275.1 hypothetical protein [gamma proteobacterium symbiont of Bathyaustriella thionipta]MCU7966148.1 hypothetical protein [gamma proteobacterium symbiont of Bathyaustriella thionipta]